MAILTAVLTHLDAPSVQRQLSYLRALAPESRFVACHGGERADFEALPPGDGVFVDDPSLRGPHFDQSMNATLAALYEAYVRDDPAIDLVYVIEYDHLILSGDFERTLAELASRSSAGLFAKNATPRNDSNWSHYLRARGDERLNRFVARISGRNDPGLRWGCLGPGMLLRREALAAFCSLTDVPPNYFELLVPTVVYHLGFEVEDIDGISDLYMSIRWLPEFSVEEAIAQKRAGRSFLHPFKRLDALTEIREAPGLGT